MTIKLKKKSWADVTLKDYEKITEIIYDTELSDAEKDVKLISIAAEVPEEDIWNLPLSELTDLRFDIFYLSKPFEYDDSLKFKKIQIGKWKCTVDGDINKLTYAQFVDFQTYVKDVDKANTPRDKAAILSCFFVPEGCKYNEGYDPAELQQAIRENVSILVYNAVWFFFLKKSSRLLRSSAISSAAKMKAMSLLMRKSNPLKKKYMEAAKAIRKVADMFG